MLVELWASVASVAVEAKRGYLVRPGYLVGGQSDAFSESCEQPLSAIAQAQDGVHKIMRAYTAVKATNGVVFNHSNSVSKAEFAEITTIRLCFRQAHKKAIDDCHFARPSFRGEGQPTLQRATAFLARLQPQPLSVWSLHEQSAGDRVDGASSAAHQHVLEYLKNGYNSNLCSRTLLFVLAESISLVQLSTLDARSSRILPKSSQSTCRHKSLYQGSTKQPGPILAL